MTGLGTQQQFDTPCRELAAIESRRDTRWAKPRQFRDRFSASYINRLALYPSSEGHPRAIDTRVAKGSPTPVDPVQRLNREIAEARLKISEEAANSLTTHPGLSEARLKTSRVTQSAHTTLTFIEAIRQLTAQGRIEPARSLLALALRLTDSAHTSLISLARLLAPPTITKIQVRGPNRELDYRWIRANFHNYRDRWVALSQGELIIAAESLSDVLADVRQRQSVIPPLIHHID